MTHITSLRIKNFLRYRGEFELTLGPGVYAVVAEDLLDKGRSNWLGKSAFLDAILWLLEDTVRDDVDTLDEMITWGEDEMAVEAEISDGTFVSRIYPRGGPTQLFVVGDGNEMKGDGAQAFIDERVVGITRDDRRTTCFALQGKVGELATARSGVLTKTVDRWLRLEKLVDAHALVTSALGKVVHEHSVAVQALALLEKDADETEIGVLRHKIVEFEEARLKSETKHKEHRELVMSFNDRTAYLRELDAVTRLESYFKELEKVPAISVPDVSKLQTEYEKQLERRNEARAQHRKLTVLAAGEFDGACPVSPGFKCPAREEINTPRAENRKKATASQAELDAEKLATTLLSNKLQMAREAEQQRERQVAALETSRREVDSSKLVCEAYKSRGVVPAKPGEVLPDAPPVFNPFELDESRRNLDRRVKAVAELPAARQRVADLGREVAAHRVAAAVVGPAGARRALSQGFADAVAAGATRDLAAAGVDLRVIPSWGRDTKEPAEQCSDCGNVFPASARVKQCERCGAARGLKVQQKFRWKLSNSSGAAKDLGGLGLRCAAFRRVRALAGSSWSVAMFDEVTSATDETHTLAVATGVRRMLGEAFDQAFVVSHNRAVYDALPNRILITGDGKWSRVEVVG